MKYNFICPFLFFQVGPDLPPPTQLHILPLFLKHKQENQQNPKTITINVACILYHRNSLKQNDKKISISLREYTYMCQNLLLFVLLVISYMFQITTKQNKKIILLFLVSLIHRIPDNDISPMELLNILM